jgi:hypothetical protein
MKDCPICDQKGTLFNKMCERNITYLGVHGMINFYYSQCSVCESEVARDWQTSVNKDNVLYFHRLVDLKGVDWLQDGIKSPSNPC